MKLSNNNFLDIFIDEKDLVRDKYIIATYFIETNLNKGDLLKATYELAVGQSIGNPHFRSNYETNELIERHSCKILHKASFLEGKNKGSVSIAFPIINIDFQSDGISQLLCMLMGGQMDIETFLKCRLIDINFPASYNEIFLPPAFGLTKTRELTKSFNKPLFGAIIKPKTGINKETLLDMIKKLIDGGVDFIKEDEILSNPSFCSLDDRVPFISNYLDKNNIKIIYTFSITGDHDVVLKRAKLVHQEGGNGIHVNLWAGLGVYKAIRKLNLPLFIHFQKSGDKVITNESHNFSIDWAVICKLAAISGVDSIHVGMIGGYLNENENYINNIVKNLLEYNVISALSCGLNAQSIPLLDTILGANYMANVGGAIHSHMEGSEAGAKKIRDAIDLFYRQKII